MKQDKIIDCREISSAIKSEVKEHIEEHDINVTLAVINVEGDDASKTYVNSKKKACEEVGITSRVIRLTNDVSERELLDVIDMLNMDENINGILVQLPLPNGIDKQKVIKAIDPNKDVDGLHPINMGKILANDSSGLTPCTPTGIIEILSRIGINSLNGLRVVIVGRSNLVGKPLTAMLINMGATVTTCNSHTVDLPLVTSQADVLITATGNAKMFTEEYVKEGSVVIDVGMNRDENGKLCGDVDIDNVIEKVAYITPVPNGVGKMTVAMLLMNTILAYHKQN